ncbi:MAG: carbonic anhydrase [Cryomorphaceae bacterium]|nr:carbonic anhydrase [Cryomorphaceae bacterium]
MKILHAQNASTQKETTPAKALIALKDGNDRFVSKKNAEIDLLNQVAETSNGQWPFAVVLSCIDSRTSSELIFDQGIGDIFNARVAGNIVNEDILGSMEYAVKYAGSKLVVVLGHTKCGAVTSACKNVEDGNITALLSKIKPAIEKTGKTGDSPEFVEEVSENNVRLTMEEIRRRSPIIAGMEKEGKVSIVGGMYDVTTGKVTFY